MTDRHAVASSGPHSVLTAEIGAIVVVFVANLLMGTGRRRGTV